MSPERCLHAWAAGENASHDSSPTCKGDTTLFLWIRKSTMCRGDLDRELHAGLRCSCRMPDLRARERRSTTSESSAPKSILQFGKLDLQKARRETQLWPINRLMFLISSAVLPCRYVAQHTTLFIPTQSCMSNRSSYLTSCCIPACRMLAVRFQPLFMHRVIRDCNR